MNSSFDQSQLTIALGTLPRLQQLVFGACVCERLILNYAAFSRENDWGNQAVLRAALDWLWALAGGADLPTKEAAKLASDCEAEAPDLDDFDSADAAFAQEACFAICSVLDFLNTADSQSIAQSAQFAVDTVDLYIQELEDMDSDNPGIEEQILQHPLMQRELAAQKLDLQLLQEASTIPTRLVDQFRARASQSGKSNIGLG